MYQIQWTKYSRDDYNKLDGSQKVFVDKAINRLKINGMTEGENLSGNLAGCKKMKNKKMGLRIVFREINNKIEVIEIIAIGKRDDMKIYKTASRRI